MYAHIGRYEGDLAPLRELLAEVPFSPCATRYETTPTTAQQRVIDLYQPYLREVFPGRWAEVMIVRIHPEGYLMLHTDAPRPGLRHHLVLESNADSWCLHDGTWQRLEEGHLFTMDQTRPHGALNWGKTPRTHLVVHTEVD